MTPGLLEYMTRMVQSEAWLNRTFVALVTFDVAAAHEEALWANDAIDMLARFHSDEEIARQLNEIETGLGVVWSDALQPPETTDFELIEEKRRW